ncbi:hypothetical protein HZY83_07325 [Gemella sp. GH3]|uniref:hypothetical protein n=1 Tax=unclassified Gemella TaxID=2624949 RepID=UPI0015D03449|nr:MULTISPECIES: hypothetical protein [unclassified Gemella]MBF0714484.1 hypothetical protein [Gemella sp. GH3.1]NYS51436.1 hypothetical protein [Gemella sp. GH3]
MAKLFNSTNIKQIDGGQVIKQGDYSSNFKFNLLDENNNPVSDINGEKAAVVLCDSQTSEVFYNRQSVVEDGAVEFKILERLPVGKYYVEIHAGGYIFPSNNKFRIVVNPSSKFEKLKENNSYFDIDTAGIEAVITNYSKINYDGLPKVIVRSLKSKGDSVADLRLYLISKINDLLEEEAYGLEQNINISNLDFANYEKLLKTLNECDESKLAYDHITDFMNFKNDAILCYVHSQQELDSLVQRVESGLSELKFDANRECIYEHNIEIRFSNDNNYVNIDVPDLSNVSELCATFDIEYLKDSTVKLFEQGQVTFESTDTFVPNIGGTARGVIAFNKIEDFNNIYIGCYNDVILSNLKIWGVRG